MRYSIIGATVEQVRSVGGTDIKESRNTGIIFATLTPDQANRLRSMGCQVTEVGKVQTMVMPPIVAPPVPVAAVPAYTPEQLIWAVRMEEIRKLFVPPLYGEGFNLAIIDSGIRETHELINGRVVYRKNFTSDPMEDGFNHGTNVCSIALAVAPLCNVLNLKALDNTGNGTEESVVLAIDECIDLQDSQPSIAPQVINVSLGEADDGNPNNPLRVACRAAIGKGLWVIAAAGNLGPASGTIICPACERYVGAVGSAKYLANEGTFVLSNFSSRGPTIEGLIKPDIIFLGEDIIMASSESDTATIAKSGTSFATPFVSAVSILFHEGHWRKAAPTQPIPGLYPGVHICTPIKDLIDIYLADICIKPQGAPAAKDNDCGCGLPFGPLVAQALGVTAAVDISAILTPVVGIGVLGMLGMIMIPMAKAFR